MDLLRSCYHSKMRPYLDRPDIEVAGRWKFCRPGAKPLPLPHRFGSQNWDWEGTSCDPPIGEVPGRGKYSSVAVNAKLTGQKFCGKEEYLSVGSPIDAPRIESDADGLPLCCIEEATVFAGIALDGEGLQANGWMQLSGEESGVSMGGEGAQTLFTPTGVMVGSCSVPFVIYCKTIAFPGSNPGWVGNVFPLFWIPSLSRWELATNHDDKPLNIRAHPIPNPGIFARLGCPGLTSQSIFTFGCNPFKIGPFGPLGITCTPPGVMFWLVADPDEPV